MTLPKPKYRYVWGPFLLLAHAGLLIHFFLPISLQSRSRAITILAFAIATVFLLAGTVAAVMAHRRDRETETAKEASSNKSIQSTK